MCAHAHYYYHSLLSSLLAYTLHYYYVYALRYTLLPQPQQLRTTSCDGHVHNIVHYVATCLCVHNNNT